MIELFDITQHYSVRPVLKRINLRIEQGELVGAVQLKFVVPPLGGEFETA